MRSLSSVAEIREDTLTGHPVLPWNMSGRSWAREKVARVGRMLGGKIDKNELRNSVMRFTQYAGDHPEFKFLVTPVGCGGGGWRPSIVAPMFREASALSNVYLPLLFWENL